ncbi:MAG: 4-hydroxy-3-methylbut-2-enyl diphosphate reductase, partial [Chloroflexi bacterium]|nr:4-hydroxy-3-methylbut-2-enyl diphosphate reductase [Chloroflexota bacterium]
LGLIDATCPLVTKVLMVAVKYAREGYSIILVGLRGHVEVIGTMGQVPEQTALVETVEDARAVDVPNPERVVALTQTTLSVDDTAGIIGVLKGRFPSLLTRNDICYATTNRQTTVKALAGEVDLVLVVGANNSSNSLRLREAAEAAGLPAYLVNDPQDIDEAWLQGTERIGITSGASTPEWLVDAVVQRLQPRQVQNLAVMEENVTFVLPKELQPAVSVAESSSR